MTAKFYASKGLCAKHPSPDLWFPEQPQGRPTQAKRKIVASKVMLALSICDDCPIKAECLAEGMKPENIEHGIWGGMLAGERILTAGIDTNRTIRRDAIVFAEGVRAWQSISVG
jgi:hypothetical protein